MHVRPHPRRAGFTLIEMVAVMLILAILVTFLVAQLGKTDDNAKERLTRAKLSELAAVIDAYERREGDFPPSAWRSEHGQPPNALNVGVEALVVALWSKNRAGLGISADELDNTDGDQSAKPLTDLPTQDLFEFVDLWGNPIAYLHHAQYGEPQRYQTFDATTGEPVETEVRALLNEKTRLPYQAGRFQLLSAGIDGVYGTEDDLSHFTR